MELRGVVTTAVAADACASAAILAHLSNRRLPRGKRLIFLGLPKLWGAYQGEGQLWMDEKNIDDFSTFEVKASDVLAAILNKGGKA